MKHRLSICALLLAALSTGSAQVASHASALLQPSDPQRPVGKPVARVNGTVLTDGDLLNEMYVIFPYARQHNGGIPKAMEGDIRAGAMKMMIFEELVYQEAERRKLTVPPERMQRAMAAFRKQFPSNEAYEQYLQQEFHGSRQLLRVKVERSLLIEKLLKFEVTDKSVATLAEAKAYYDKNPGQFRIPESFAIQTISIIPPQSPNPAQLKEAQKRANNALHLAKLTKTYEEFGLLAEKVSEDDFRVVMGDHKAADRSKLPPEVVNAVLAMQPGQVSDLIHFDNVYTVIRLNAHIPAGMQKFADVKDSLRQQLAKKKTEQLRGALDQMLRKNAKVEEL
jgi:peptidyl-prolyl cis-trans isomerase C